MFPQSRVFSKILSLLCPHKRSQDGSAPIWINDVWMLGLGLVLDHSRGDDAKEDLLVCNECTDLHDTV